MANFSLNYAIIDVLQQNNIFVIRCERHDIFNPYEDSGYADLKFDSPAGEEIHFCVSLNPKDIDQSFVDGFCQYANEFDPDEHVEALIPSRGQRGVPNSIRELLDDADDIKEFLEDVGCDLQKALVKTKELETSTEEEKADSDGLSLD